MFTLNDIKTSLTSFSKVSGIEMEKFRVASSGAMVLLGLKTEARDLDLEVTEDIFDKLKNSFPLNLREKPYQNEHPLFPGVLEYMVFETENGEMEFMRDTIPFKVTTQVTEGVAHLTKESVVDFKLWLGREKDIKHLKDAKLI